MIVDWLAVAVEHIYSVLHFFITPVFIASLSDSCISLIRGISLYPLLICGAPVKTTTPQVSILDRFQLSWEFETVDILEN